MGKPMPAQLARINQLAKEPLTDDQVYVFPDKLVGDKVIPLRFQRITPNFLRKMSDQAKEGISLLLDHSWANLGVMTIPLGRSYDAKLQQEPDGELALYGDFYMRRGQTINGISTDELAASIDAGTIFDSSIGFYATKHICSICSLDYFGGECMHIRGRTYGDDEKLCIVDLDDGGLMENSLVFDGAYPGAGISGLSNKESPEHQSEWVPLGDTKSLPGDGRVFYSFSNKSGLNGFVRMAQTQSEGVDQVNELEQAQQKLAAANALLSVVRTALGVASDDGIESALTALKANAQIGQQYAAKVVDEALASGVRAMGAAFDAEAMKAALSLLSVGEVEKIRDTYNAQAKTALGGGGQHVVTQEHDLPGDPNANPQAASAAEPADKFSAARPDAVAALKRQGKGHLIKEAN